MTARKTSCNNIELLLTAYCDGEAGDGERADVEAHLPQCPACSARLEEIKALASALRALPRMEPSRDLTEGLEALLAASSRKRQRILPLSAVWVGLAAAAAVTAMVVAFRFIAPAPPIVAGGAPQPSGQGAPPAGMRGGAPGKQPVVSAGGTQVSPGTRQSGSPAIEPALPAGRGSAPAGSVRSAPAVVAGGAGTVLHSSLAQGRPDPQVSAGAGESRERFYAAVAVDDPDSAAAVAPALALLPGDEAGGITESLGIATDEDGLYAIKM